MVFNSRKWSNLAWSSSNSVTIYFCIVPLCSPANASSRKAFVFILKLEKMIECFWQYYYVYMSSGGPQKRDSPFWRHCSVRFTCLKVIRVWQTRRSTSAVHCVQASEQRVAWSWKASRLHWLQISRIWQLLFMPLMKLVPWIMDHAAHCRIHP